MAVDRSKIKWDEPRKIDPAAVQWDGGAPAEQPANTGTVDLSPLPNAGPIPAAAEPASFLQRTLRGIRDPIDAGAQMLTRGIESAIPDSWETLDQWAKGQVANVEGINAAAEQDYQQNWRGGETGFDGARLVGNIVGGIPVAMAMPAGAGLGLGARTASSAVGGAIASALQPVYDAGDDFWSEKAGQFGTGALIGGAVAPVAAAAGRLISPRSSPEVQALLSEGVTPTPGQVLGGAFKTTEEKLASVPLLGDAIKSGQRRANRQLNEAALQRALDPIGQRLPSGMIGREGIQHVDDVLGQSYDDVINRVGAPAVDNQMLSELANLRALIANQPKGMGDRLDDIIGNEILSRTQNGRLTGEAIRAAESNLGRTGVGLRSNADFDTRQLGDAVTEAQRILRTWLERSAPADVSEQLRNTNAGWTNFIRSRQAAAGVGAQDGVFNASQLQGAVKALDRSKGKAAFAKGEAPMQDLSDAAKSVLAQEVPDSGTAGRLLSAALAGGAGVGAVMNPAIAAAAIPAAAYAPGVQRLMASLLAGRQQAPFKAGSELIRALTPASAALLAPQLTQ